MSLKNLSFSDLELILELASQKSVRGAARERSQNAAYLSKSLRRIELETGHSLFKRTATGLSLTPEGITFRENAKRLLGLLPALATPQKGKQGTQKIFSIGSSNLLNAYVLPEVFVEVGESHPKAGFRLLDLAPDRILSFGTRGMIDFAAYWDPIQWTKSWESREAGEIPYGLFGRKGHPLGREATPTEIREFPFVVPIYVDHTNVRFGDDRCPIPISKRIRGHQTSTASSAMRIARSTDQLVYVPRCAVSGSEYAQSLSEIYVPEWPKVSRSIFIACSTEMPKSVFDDIFQALRDNLKL